MISFPSAEDYIQAVQQRKAFLRPELRDADFELHPSWGIPVPASGNAAVVFKAQVEGSAAALRFFIREDASSRERYTALGRHFADREIEDCVARANWVDEAISVKEARWPMVQMAWVDGRTLDTYVGHLARAGNAGALAQLAENWRVLVGRLQGAEFAHGDLQHGNVMVDTASALRLVDFDGSWIEAFGDGPPPNETGHPNYQRTGRVWGRWMDTFPGLVIYTALLTLSRRPAAWGDLHTGENLLFSAGDFAPPFRTPAWNLVQSVGDARVQQAAERLRDACGSNWRAADTLESVLGERNRIVTASPDPLPPAGTVRDVWVPRQGIWWEPSGAEPGSPASAMPAPPPRSGPGSSGASGASVAGEGTTYGSSQAWYSPTMNASGPGSGPTQPPSPPVPPHPKPPAMPGTARPLAGILVVACLVMAFTGGIAAAIVGGNGGDGGPAGVLSGVIAGILTFIVLLRRKS